MDTDNEATDQKDTEETEKEATDQKDTEETEKEATLNATTEATVDADLLEDVETISVEEPVAASTTEKGAIDSSSSTAEPKARAIHHFQVGDTVRCRSVCNRKVPKINNLD